MITTSAIARSIRLPFDMPVIVARVLVLMNVTVTVPSFASTFSAVCIVLPVPEGVAIVAPASVEVIVYEASWFDDASVNVYVAPTGSSVNVID